MANEYAVNQADLAAVADVIRAKGGTSDALTFPDGFVSAVSAIQTGGGIIPFVQTKDVNFYDYDGTRVYAYTIEEAQALTELPAGPTHNGLIFDGWNWSLEDIKAANTPLTVGAMYITDDGKTRLYITLQEGRTSPMLGVGVNGTVTVDWGDGTEPDVLTGTNTGTVQWTPTHTYAAPGDYMVTLSCEGDIQLSGSSAANEDSCILRYSSDADARNAIYQAAVKKVEIGKGCTFSTHVFRQCIGLTTITFPNNTLLNKTGSFANCYSLTFFSVPDGTLEIHSNCFLGCNSFANIAIPNRVKTISVNSFLNCSSLSSIIIPSSVVSIANTVFSNCRSLSTFKMSAGVTTINAGLFTNCLGVAYYDFSAYTTVPALANASAFSGIADDCEIRVPAVLYDEWITATNWATYADYIVAV